MMSKQKHEMQTAELDRALAAAENDSTGRMLAATPAELQPHPEFVRRLEMQLRAGGGSTPLQTGQAGLAWPAWRSKRFAFGSALLLALALAAGLFWLNGAAPVSAQQVLERAAAGKMQPNQIVHRTYKLEQAAHMPHTGSAEVWMQADASGNVSHAAMTFTGFADNGAVATVQRIVMNGQAAQKYDYRASDNTLDIRAGTYAEVNDGDPNLFDGAGVAQYLGRIAQGSVQGVQLLPTQTFEGVQVLAIRVASPNPNSTTYPDQSYTAYFDAQSYVLRGMEIPDGRVWMTLEEPAAEASLRPDTFSLNPPPNARVTHDNSSGQNPGGISVGIQTLLDFCYITQPALEAAQTERKTVLAACQSGRPGTTQAELADALLAPLRAQWDDAVRAGKMTAAQQADYYSNAQKKLAVWIMSPLTQ